MQPRRSRRIRSLSTIAPFQDAGIMNESDNITLHEEHVTLLQVATKGKFVSGHKQFKEGNPTGKLHSAIDSYFNSNECKPLENYMARFVLNQMSAKARIRKYRKVAIEALMKEFA